MTWLLAVVLAVAGAAPAPAGARVPGLALRFGEPLARVDSTRAWSAEPGTGGAAVRSRRTPFFGVPCAVTLRFQGERLAQVEARADSASPAAIDYIRDELRRLGLRPTCAVDRPGDSRCTWSGPALVALQVQRTTLTATLTPPPESPPPPPAVVAAPRFDGPPPEFDLEHLDAAAPWPAPEVLHREEPVIPTIAREAGVMGRVRVRASVDSMGAVTRAEILKSIPMLDAAAVDCVKHWRFKPYAPAGRALAFRVLVSVLLVLD